MSSNISNQLIIIQADSDSYSFPVSLYDNIEDFLDSEGLFTKTSAPKVKPTLNIRNSSSTSNLKIKRAVAECQGLSVGALPSCFENLFASNRMKASSEH